MKQRSENYWAKRSLARSVTAEKQSIPYLKRIQKVYKNASKSTIKEIQKLYANYYKDDKTFDLAKLNQITPSGDTKRFLKAMEKAGLSTYLPDNYKARMSRLEALDAQIWGEIKQCAMTEQAQTSELYGKVYENSYYKTGYDVMKGTDVNVAFSTLDTPTINRVLEQKYYGSDFSERVWANTDKLAKSVGDIIAEAVATGASSEKTARLVRDRFNVGISDAARLVRTETAYFENQAEFAAYEEMGIEQYQILETLDHKCCAVCQEMDYKIFKTKDREDSVNAPPFHPYCRGTTTPYLKEWEPEERTARDPETGKNYQVGDMSYKEWKASLEANEQTLPQDLSGASARKVNMNTESDVQKTSLSEQTSIAGAKRGEPMTFEKADGKKVNPHFYDDVGYQKNCQSCVVAYEARRRGYDVEALSKTNNSIANALSDDPTLAWIDSSTGKKRSSTIMSVDSASDALGSLKSIVGDGERYTFSYKWRDNSRNKSGRHIVSIEKNNGKLQIYDPQSGGLWDTDESILAYLNDGVVYSPPASIMKKAYDRVPNIEKTRNSYLPALTRVDDLDFNAEVVNAIMRKKEA